MFKIGICCVDNGILEMPRFDDDVNGSEEADIKTVIFRPYQRQVTKWIKKMVIFFPLFALLIGAILRGAGAY